MRPIAYATSKRPVPTLIVTAVLVVLAFLFGSQAIPKLSGGGHDNPNADSSRVLDILAHDFNVEEPYVTIAIGNDGVENSVDDPTVTSAAQDVLKNVASMKGVVKVESYWSLNRAPQLRSVDGSLGLALVYVKASDVEGANRIAKKIANEVPATLGEVHFYVGGAGAVYNSVNAQVTKDIAFAESISIPLSIVLLLFVFGAAVAASMPILVGVSAIGGALFFLNIVTHFTDISIFALNLLTGLGLGLGIDYALLIVNRFREELHRGADVETAVETTVHTAGRTVMVSGLAVATTLAAMIVFPQGFIKSMAWAGVSVTLMAVLGALVPLPAALRLLGHRIDKLRLRRGQLAPKDEGVWSVVARVVMRHPWISGSAALALLAVCASPLLGVHFGQVDERVLPKSAPVVVASNIIHDRFASSESTPIDVLFPASVPQSEVAQFARDASRMDGIVRVQAQAGIYANGALTPLGAAQGWPTTKMETADYNRLVIISNRSARSDEGQQVVRNLRDMNQDAIVGGSAAFFIDSLDAIFASAPIAALWVVIATLFILFLFTGSVWLPIKAVMLNVVSLAAALGSLTYVFQDGHLQWLTGPYQITNTLDLSSLVLVVIVTFGLSMDYEVFLLSRIKEEHDRGSDTVESVALGLQRSGRIITAAAVLLAAVFAAFVTSSVTSVKLLGFGIAFAILLDATVVRGVLVPSLMRIAGRFNWWAPRPLRWLHDRIGLAD